MHSAPVSYNAVLPLHSLFIEGDGAGHILHRHAQRIKEGDLLFIFPAGEGAQKHIPQSALRTWE